MASTRVHARAALLAAAVFLSAPSVLHAQCPGPDGLAGPCWERTDALLPDFPPFVLPGAGLCWDNCDPLPKDPNRVSVGTPVPVQCGQYRSDVTVFDVGGLPVLTGTATLDYTRTWLEVNPIVGAEFQVWRMLLKIDFTESPLAPPVCWNPPCLGPPLGHDTCFWYGYVDWAQDCATGQFQNAVVMYHACDDFIHNPFLSSTPTPFGGAFHPTSYYAIVAPDIPANPFDPTPILSPRSGDVFAEAVRNVTNPFAPGTCTKEERIAQGRHDLLGDACLCPLASAPPTQSASHYLGFGTCTDPAGVPSSWLSLKIFDLTVGFKWFDLMATSLGSWTTDDAYPGKEAPFTQEGFFAYHDSCAATFGLAADTLDFHYGAKTTGGWLVDSFDGVPLTRNFLDLASNYSLPFVALPLLGSVAPTDHLIYANIFP